MSYKDNDPPRHFNVSEFNLWNTTPKNRSFFSKLINNFRYPKEIYISWEDYIDLMNMGAQIVIMPNRIYKTTRKRYKSFKELMQQLEKWRKEQNIQNQDEPGLE